MRAKEYSLMVQCVQTGIMLGWNRARKHSENPDPDMIRGAIEQAVLDEICQWFDFEEFKDDNN